VDGAGEPATELAAREAQRATELIGSIVAAASELASMALSSLDPAALGALLSDAERARSHVDAAANRVLARFDAIGAAGHDGLRTTGAWLRQRCQMTSATAARRVRTARALRDLPVVAEGFRTGRFSADQADLFARARTPRTAEAMTQDESTLAALADRLRADELARELRGWVELVDTDGAEPDPGHRGRSFSFVQTLDGAWTGRLDLSGADGWMVDRAVAAMAEALRGSCESGEETRSPAQRRADALVELVRRGCGQGTSQGDADRADARRRAPRVTLHLTLNAGDLEGGRGADPCDGGHLGPAGTDRILSVSRGWFEGCVGALKRRRVAVVVSVAVGSGSDLAEEPVAGM
jgi:hypothetical protein